MTFVYPPSWNILDSPPQVRFALTKHVQSIAEWNSAEATIKRDGTDALLDFFYDMLAADENLSSLEGLILFSDEICIFEDFFAHFDKFVRSWKESGHEVGRLHEATLPSELTARAQRLLNKLNARGIARWRG